MPVSIGNVKVSVTVIIFMITCDSKKVTASHTRYRALGPELIPVYRQSARK